MSIVGLSLGELTKRWKFWSEQYIFCIVRRLYQDINMARVCVIKLHQRELSVGIKWLRQCFFSSADNFNNKSICNSKSCRKSFLITTQSFICVSQLGFSNSMACHDITSLKAAFRYNYRLWSRHLNLDVIYEK